jgi:hypothetical protein
MSHRWQNALALAAVAVIFVLNTLPAPSADAARPQIVAGKTAGR